MREWIRPLFFWTLVVLFFITVPVVVLRARGYRFDSSRGVFVYSGAITFKSNPEAVDVALNDKVTYSQKINRINNSFNLNGLLPASYEMRISSPGFRSWNKKIEVHSGLSTEFWNILLVREEYAREKISGIEAERFYLSPENNFIAAAAPSEDGLKITVWDMDSQKNVGRYEIPGWKIIPENLKENIEWSPDEKNLSIPVSKGLERSYFIADLEKGEISQLINPSLGEGVREVRWHPEKEKFVIFLSGNSLYQKDISNPESLEIFAENVSAYDISGSSIYFVRIDNHLVFRAPLENRADLSQLTSRFPEAENEIIDRIVVYDDTRLAFFSEKNKLFIFNRGEKDTYFRPLGESIQEAHFSNDGKKLLYWNDYEISIYYVRDEMSQPQRLENEGHTITRYMEPIRNAQWFDDYEHVIFSTGKFVKVIELDPRDKRNCLDIFATQTEKPFVIYAEYLGKIIFTDSEQNQPGVYSLEFPEKKSFFGI